MSVETIKCQECGSSDVTEFKAGGYVCGHCEAVFKHVGPAGSVAEPCVFCGSDSVATCKQCSRRVCNHCMVVSVTEVDPGYAAAHLGVEALHAVRLVHPIGSSVESPPFERHYRRGFTGGPPRCMGCRHVDGKAGMAAAPQRAAEQEHEREVVASKLRTSSDVDEIARLIVDGDPRTPADAYQAGWIKFAASSMREPDADVVTLKFSKSLFGGNWTETSRHPAWKLANVPRKNSERRYTNLSKSVVWLDDMATCWAESTGGIGGYDGEVAGFATEHGQAVSLQKRPKQKDAGRRGWFAPSLTYLSDIRDLHTGVAAIAITVAQSLGEPRPSWA